MKRYFFLLLLLLANLANLFAEDNSILSQGDWYKISTTSNGVYKLTYSDLKNLGINTSNLKASSIRLHGNGGGMLPKLNSETRCSDLIEVPIKIYDGNNNGFFESEDYFLFYGMSSDIWRFNEISNLFEHEIHLFANEVNYFITVDNESQGSRIEEETKILNPTKQITEYSAYAYHEQELENLIKSGRKWFGEQFLNGNSINFNFSFPDLLESEELNIKIGVAARSLETSAFRININSAFFSDLSVPSVSSNSTAEFAIERSLNKKYLSSSQNIGINLEYSSQDNGAKAWLDYIEINARRKLKIHGNDLFFRDIESISNEVGEFVIENANGFIVWDITDQNHVRQLSTSMLGNTIFFNDSLTSLHEYIVFNNSAYLTPILRGAILNQNVHNIGADIEYIIVSHPDFLNAANRLADFHEQKDNLRSVVVTPQQIYNEFSSGMQDVSAIRDFMKFQYEKEDSELKYLLLFGDGSYDPKNRVENNTNFIPTYQSLNSTSPTLSYVTDDYFALLDEDEGLFLDDFVDIGVGRFPVSTVSEANILVDKVEQYYHQSSFGSWRNNIAFIADDGDSKDGNTFMRDSDSLANIVSDNYTEINIQKIYLDNYAQESTPGGPRSEVTQNIINNSIEKGALLVNYTGHGGPLGWAQERILEIDQIQNWNNFDNLPLFMTATCKFSYFDNPEQKSAGEYVLLNPDGGAIALLTTTRLVYSGPNYNLNTKFINTIFEKQNGDFPRLGDVFKMTKVLSGTSPNNRNFTLLGDPALRLAYPTYDVATTMISDTLKALGEVTIQGQVEGNGVLLSDFNGTIYSTVYDKEIIRTTLGQESCTPMPYRDQNNIVYKGSASVINGEFSFSFIVPKDISYYVDTGKISYYAINDDELNPADANGFEEGFVIGGTADNITYDYDKAELSLFMNDRNFKDGGITDKNPILIADVFDLSGINTVGNGIGHDITAVLDGNTSNPYVINDFYEAKKDDYSRGEIRFPLYNLDKGDHTITLKVWDVFNNPSEKTINFVVFDENELVIADFTAFPNPFSNSTDIYFQHNKADEELNYVLDIYSVTGVLVKRIEESSYNSIGYRIGPISWDGTNLYGGKISAGVYVATLGVRDKGGNFSSKSMRIILLP
ncbi:MAG: hypothetical protein CMD16_04280 [Flavobacteriales bacterium]|nr:hypothetical protein [Flavobacteriales bacterium]|tara:strand:- start:25707 stop:29069 length:3363 start_codon:yes stop_codon:yes gene_type:complete